MIPTIKPRYKKVFEFMDALSRHSEDGTVSIPRLAKNLGIKDRNARNNI
ncbi:MAG: hypothetical protein ACTSUE_25410 [Promethearchaeota archaeon]